MCLVTFQQIAFTSTEDIVVFKMVRPIKENVYQALRYNSFTYTLNEKTPKEELVSLLVGKESRRYSDHIAAKFYSQYSIAYSIDRGYHSSSLSLILNLGVGWFNSIHILKCIIPKSSRYFKDEVGNYVSEYLLPLKDVTIDYKRILRKENWPLTSEEMNRLKAELCSIKS